MLAFIFLSLISLAPAMPNRPNWTPTWNLSRSTAVMPCNDSGFVEPLDFYAQFGLVDFDWSNAKALWVHPPMRDEEMLVEQCALLKAINPEIKCFVYRNLNKALPWYTSVRDKITDPAYSGWFLKNKVGGSLPNGSYHVSQCDHNYNPPLCSTLYHDNDQTPGFPHGDGSCPGPCDCGEGVPCGEYVWDHRNDTLRDWFVNDFLLGPTGLGNESVDGFYFDDGWANTSQPIDPSWMPKEGYCDHSPIGGVTEENYWCTADMGLTQADTTAITDGWKTTMNLVEQTVIGAGAYAWAFFQHWSPPTSNSTTCASTMRFICNDGTNWGYYAPAVQVQWTLNDPPYNSTFARTSPLQKVASDLGFFLTVRGPFWWIGYAWVGCSVPYDFPPALSVDYGEPLGTCAETGTGTGVFERKWSKATSSVDCNNLEGKIEML